jgi:hypothetical protein
MRSFLRRHAAKLAIGAAVLLFYMLAVPRDLSHEQMLALASQFRFEVTSLHPADNGRPLRTMRAVHPDLKHIDAWISSLGASVALADIEGSGRPADICLVDPQNDSVSVMPAPGTGSRYEPFVLPFLTEGYAPSTIAPMGCLAADVNEDGRTDLVVYFWGRTPLVFLQMEGTGLSAARFKAVEIVPTRERWNTNCALFVDVDGDGHPDLLFGNYFRDGDRILDPAAADSVEMPHSLSRAFNGGRNRLLLWQSAGADAVTFRDVSAALTEEMANGWTLALGAADLTGDLLPEIYVANDFGPDRLLLNKSTPGAPAFQIVEGRRDLTIPRSKVLGQDSFKGMGVDFGDIKGDGRPAIVVSNIAETYALVESHFLFVHTGDDAEWARGYAPYRDEASARGVWIGGWAWDVKFADLTNGGSLQILQATGFIKGKRNAWQRLHETATGNDELLRYPASWHRFGPEDDVSGRGNDRLLVADASGRYHDIWLSLGLDRDTISRGIALGDVYGDGRLAIAVARQWMPSLFLRNVSPKTGAALVLDLRVPGTVGGTRPAIGAKARIVLSDGRILAAQIDGGSGHGGRRAPEIHLGLGHYLPAGQAVKVELTWRDIHGIHRRDVQLLPGRHRIVLGEKTVAQTEAHPDQ